MLNKTFITTTLLWSIYPALCLSLANAQDAPSSAEIEQLLDGALFPTERITVPGWRKTDGPHVRTAFRSVIADTRLATVRVRAEGRDIALGGIVDSQGLILTKASRLTGKITCRLTDGRELKAKVLGIDRDYDLALLQVNAQQLPALNLKQKPPAEHPPSQYQPAVGSWLATVGMNRGPLAVGVVSVEPRKIPHRAGILGIRFGIENERAVIEEIFSKTAAEKAGLLPGDEFLSVDGQLTPTRVKLVDLIRTHSPGDRVQLKIRRNDQTLDIAATLQGKRPWQLPSREDFQNQLGSQLSQRRFGFPMAFQHDTVVKPSDCGGPIVDLDGQVVGFNLARAGRTETFAIPIAEALKTIAKLK